MDWRKIYSNSKISTFEQCRKKFYYNYIKRLKIRKQRPYLTSGLFCHDVLEDFYDVQYYGTDPLDRMNMLIGKYLKLDRYDGSIFDAPKAVVMLHEYIERYGHRNIEVLDLEYNFRIQYKGVKIIGKIDRIDKIGENAYEIIDYKTTSNPKYLKNSLQLAIYLLAAAHKYGNDKEYKLSYILLKHDSKKMVVQHQGALQKLPGMLTTVEEIETENKWEKTIGPLCDYCDFQGPCFSIAKEEWGDIMDEE